MKTPFNFKRLSTLVLTLAASTSALATPNSAYIRFPSIHLDTVVFTAEGDLWKVVSNGGQAQRMTTHPGAETYPAISRDGLWLAFSANYENGQEAYVMPMTGGVPKRISFDNSSVTVLGWTAQGEVLVTMQNKRGPALQTIIAAINPQNLHSTIFPVTDANEAALDETGKILYFTRLGLHTRNDNAKNYRGGAVAQLWRIDLNGQAEASHLFATEKSNTRRPMLWKNRLYFLSDRQGAYNLYSANLDGNDVRTLTQHQDWDVRNPNLGDGKIVYQLGADLHVLELTTRNDKTPKIELISDFDQSRQRQIRSPLELLSTTQIAAKEEKMVVTARGQISIVGNKNQRRVDISLPKGARAREAIFSSDDRWVYAFVDATGENEIWRFPANGVGAGEVLTRDGQTHRVALQPSPDGKWIAHSDKRGKLFLLDLASKTNTLIDDAGKSGFGEQDEFVWSNDSKTLALVRANNSMQRPQIGLYDITSKQLQFVTSDRYESSSPTFSNDGRWLYFLSNRNFQAINGAPWGDRNMGPLFDKRTGVYALALQAGNRFPFKPDDELYKASEKPEVKTEAKADLKTETQAIAKSETKEAEKILDDTKKSNANKKASPAIQYAGLNERLYEVPIAAGNYRHLRSDDKRLYFLDRDINDRSSSTLKIFPISNNAPQVDVFAAQVREYDLSLDRKHVYLRSGNSGVGDFYLMEAAPKSGDFGKTRIRIDDWSFSLDPRLEWKEMFMDAWRMHRDFLYDDKMRGIDWLKMRDKYAPLVEHVTDRAELNDVLGMMVSELGALHSQVRPGIQRSWPAEGLAASLGAILSRSAEGYRIDYIYRSETEIPSLKSPLDSPDLDVKEGDLITAINGKSVAEVRDISDLLINQSEHTVLIDIKRGAAASKPVLVTPINMARHHNLRYGDWEQDLTHRVDTASKGKIGYLHLRAMTPSDLAGFARDFYANIDREGLIIDVRRNNGGNIDSWIIEKLLRKTWSFWSSPGNQASGNMQQTFRGHLVVLIDELTYSDGETFAAGIKALKLAPLIGKRSAGAGVWLSDRNTLSDNGMVRAAENAQFDANDGHWLVEGVGVAPDIEVDNLPHASFLGEDKQLEAAIKLLQNKLKEQPIKALQAQPIPAIK